MAASDAPIGLFDSGLGGLSVLREVRTALPAEHLLYYADSAFCPYGARPPSEIRARCQLIAAALLDRGAKALIVACNTASSVALAQLRQVTGVPVVGLVPAVKPAVALSRAGRVAVLATPRTADGALLGSVVAAHAGGAEVTILPAPGLADLVESGQTAGPAVEALLRRLLEAPLRSGVDTVVLGCTHYPFVRPVVEAVVGPRVAVIDSGEAIARRTASVLADQGGLRSGTTPGHLALFTSGVPATVGAVASTLLGESVRPSFLPL